MMESYARCSEISVRIMWKNLWHAFEATSNQFDYDFDEKVYEFRCLDLDSMVDDEKLSFFSVFFRMTLWA